MLGRQNCDHISSFGDFESVATRTPTRIAVPTGSACSAAITATVVAWSVTCSDSDSHATVASTPESGQSWLDLDGVTPLVSANHFRMPIMRPVSAMSTISLTYRPDTRDEWQPTFLGMCDYIGAGDFELGFHRMVCVAREDGRHRDRFVIT